MEKESTREKLCGEWIPKVYGGFWSTLQVFLGFKSDPSERAYPVRPIMTIKALVSPILLSTAHGWILDRSK